jgi:hypothetical protein
MVAPRAALFQGRPREHLHLILQDEVPIFFAGPKPRGPVAAVPIGCKFSDLLSTNSRRVAGRALTASQTFIADTARMRLSTWLIIGLSAAYVVDMLYCGGAYSMAAITLFRHVGMGVLAGLSQYV